MKKQLLILLFTVCALVSKAQTYQTVPARVEAESYYAMHGVGTENSTDESGGLDIGWIADSSWMDYAVSVPVAGYYTVEFRIANGFSDDATFQLKGSAGNLIGEFIVPRTGGMQSWKTVRLLLPFPAGNQTLRVLAQKGIFSFNWFQIIDSSRSVPAKIESEDYDLSYGIATESTSDTGSGLNVSNIDDNDWMDYIITADSTQEYTFSFRVANSWGNGVIQIRNVHGTVLGQVSVPQTGWWQNWTTVSTTAQLQKGSQILRIFARSGAFNVNWMDITRGSVAPPEPSVLTFQALEDKTYGDTPFVISASSNNPGAPVTFTSSNPAVVSLSQSGGTWTATIHSAGSVVITASQAAAGNFTAAQNVERTLVVKTSAYGAPKITLDPKRWYQLNNAEHGLEALFDGLTQENVHTGWGKVVDTYEAYYPLYEGEEMSLSRVKFFDYEGIFSDRPMTLSVINSQWQRIPVATFTGDIYNGWVGPYPGRSTSGEARFDLDSTLTGIRYLVLTIQSGMPTEMELYGTHVTANPPQSHDAGRDIKLKDMFGVNAYEWNFQDGNTPWQINESRMDMAKSFTGIRHYMDWQKLESQEGVYSYNPTLSGGWHYDQIYERCKEAGIEVLACLKTLPDWMLDTYPPNERDHENVPVRYGSDFADPASYIEQARIGFQYAARYGSNTQVNPSLLSVYTTPRWPGDNPNTVKIGMDLIKYIECDNERDKWWKGRKGYQTAREYAANLSAFYDGHKNTLGSATGVKNADPDMKVVIAGLVSNIDYIKGMVDWCKEFRGYHPDGRVNLCWDVINYHIYTDNTSSSQSGTSTRGAAPEVTIADEKTTDFVTVAQQLCYGMPVWITETGFDVHQDSPLKAIPIGTKTALDTQADWILRMSLFSARHGIEKVFFYQMYDDNATGMIFGSSGLINSNLTRRPAADFLYQANKLFGEYVYKQTLQADPIVDRYELDGHPMYALVVPDETGRTATYHLAAGSNNKLKVYKPKAGVDNMEVQEISAANGAFSIPVGETPVFAVPYRDSTSARIASSQSREETMLMTAGQGVSVYPNPTSDYFQVSLGQFSASGVKMRLFSASHGTLYIDKDMSARTPNQKISISHLPAGHYILELSQGEKRVFKKILKEK